LLQTQKDFPLKYTEISYVSKEWQRIWKEGIENLDYEQYHGSSSIPPVPYKSAWESKNCGLQILGWNGPPIPGKDLSADKRRSLVRAMQLGHIVMKPLHSHEQNFCNALVS